MTAAAGIQTYTFHVNGMHCKACVWLSESELAEHPKVVSAKSSLRTQSVEIRGDFGDRPLDEIAEELSALLSEHSLSTTVPKKHVAWDEFGVAVPIAISLRRDFRAAARDGHRESRERRHRHLSTAFLVGVVASLSTCMAIVGGLVLSISATFARSGDRTKPQALFHVGRVASFLVLGGVIGLLGSAFRLNSTGTFVLSLSVALFMLALGVNLLNVFRWASPLQPSMPRFISKRALGSADWTHTLHAGAGRWRDVLPALRLHTGDAVLRRLDRQSRCRRSHDVLLRPRNAAGVGAA